MEQLIAQQAAQSLQGIADCRLRHAQRLRRARNTALDHQLMEDTKQLEIKIIQVHQTLGGLGSRSFPFANLGPESVFYYGRADIKHVCDSGRCLPPLRHAQ
ncbi:hypothetical protein [uncultured Nevskia sp.]|uniref:hypothetical protein n=1 Tax=uncultured Nevskia sp. TaxID=228950 RepID=UPI0025D743A8|nr:hypothetical protein [uncultured Nevskia sp.]